MKVKNLMKIALGSLILASCATTDMEEIPAEEQYLRDFIKKYGLIDPNQNWNLAVRITAEVDAEAVRGASTINVYTEKPGSEACRLAARYGADQKSFMFDFPRSADQAYVVAYDDARRIILSGYCEIQAGKINITRQGVKSRALDMSETPSQVPALGAKIEDLGTLKDTENRFPRVEADVDGNKKRTDIFSMYHLNSTENFKTVGSQWYKEDLIPILGADGIFPEAYSNAEKGCNLARWESVLNMDVEMITKSTGPVSLGLMCGGTDFVDKYGYIYYSGDTHLSGEELKNYIARQNRYILIEDGRPSGNITKVNGEAVGNMWIPYNLNTDNTFPLTASRYYLTYFGEDGKGEPTYDFPANIHIIFFEIIQLQNESDYDAAILGSETKLNGTLIRYSLPWMNEWTGHMRREGHGPNQHQDKQPAIKFVKFKWKDTTGKQNILIGCEDGGYWNSDDDMNDIMFVVNGDFEDDSRILEPGDDPEHLDDPDPDPDPEAQSWILAVEDLGETDDYDFNDIVLEVSHVSGETKAIVKALAAGGIMEIKVKYNGSYLSNDHVNKWFGESDHTKMLNTESGITATHDGIEIEVPEDWTLTDENMGGFVFEVTKADGTVTAIRPTSAKSQNQGEEIIAPLMICVPGDWEWPIERTSIEDAYPGFKDWVSNSNFDWISTKVSGKVITRSK